MDINKIFKTPKDRWEAIDFMNNARQELVEAIYIINSFIKNNNEHSKEFSEARAKKFLKNYE